MRYVMPLVALVLCVAALTVLALDLPSTVVLVVVGAFVLLTPGLLVLGALRLPDRLLALVVGLLVGPCLWVIVGTVQLFTGLWAPRVTVLWAAGILALASVAQAVVDLRRFPGADTTAVRGSRVEEYAAEEAD